VRKSRISVIGIGNEYRSDDGLGPAVVARLRGRVPDYVDLLVSDGEPVRLVEDWAGAALVVLVDAVRGRQPGRLHRIVLAGAEPGECPRLRDEPGLATEIAASSHGLGAGTAVELASALGRLPDRLIMHAVEAWQFDQGRGLSPEVAGVIEELTAAVLADVTRDWPDQDRRQQLH
jgi:hydrogenase maturation protease